MGWLVVMVVVVVVVVLWALWLLAVFGHTGQEWVALIGMGSTALSAAVPCPGKATRISRMGR